MHMAQRYQLGAVTKNDDESSCLRNDESLSKYTLRFQNFEEKADVKTCFLCHDITQILLIKKEFNVYNRDFNNLQIYLSKHFI